MPGIWRGRCKFQHPFLHGRALSHGSAFIHQSARWASSAFSFSFSVPRPVSATASATRLILASTERNAWSSAAGLSSMRLPARSGVGNEPWTRQCRECRPAGWATRGGGSRAHAGHRSQQPVDRSATSSAATPSRHQAAEVLGVRAVKSPAAARVAGPSTGGPGGGPPGSHKGRRPGRHAVYRKTGCDRLPARPGRNTHAIAMPT